MALAIFDLDDTLIKGDSASLWLAFMVEQGLADANMLEQEAAMMQAYRTGSLNMSEYMAFTLHPLCSVELIQVADWVGQFVEQRILPLVYAEARALLAHYQQHGWRRLIISATGEHLVGPIARALGVDDYLAIQLTQADGRYTGATQGVLTYQHGKVARLQQWTQQQQQSLLGSHGYSDSINDLPLLAAVSQAHVVNPDAQLAAQAKARQWPQLNWA